MSVVGVLLWLLFMGIFLVASLGAFVFGAMGLLWLSTSAFGPAGVRVWGVLLLGSMVALIGWRRYVRELAFAYVDFAKEVLTLCVVVGLYQLITAPMAP